MDYLRILACFAPLLFSLPAAGQIAVLAAGQPQTDTQSENMQQHVITISRGGEAYAKPDLGILVMSIRSTSALADEAVSQNAQKAKAGETGLAQLGISPANYKITSVTFATSNSQFGPPQPSGITAYDATQSIYVFFNADELKDVVALTEQSAKVIEALRKAGAVPGNASNIRMPAMPGSLIYYTIKDPAPYEHQAVQQAITRARDASQDVAAAMGVQVAGLRNIRSSFLYGNYNPRSTNSPLEGLNYRWYSTNSDQVEIGASATVDYDFK